MGMIRCPVHGLTHITTCCIHIGEAVDANRFEHATVVVDHSGTAHVLCDRCLPQAEAQLRAGPSNVPGGNFLQLDPPLEPYCHKHLIEWYEATGQGNLSEEIKRARARAKP